MATKRLPQVNVLLARAIAEILLRDIDFPKGIFITILDVRTSGDLKHATVTVSIFPSEKRGTALALLQKTTPHIVGLLHERVVLRRIPDLAWTVDTTEDKAAEVEALLDSIA